MKATRLIIWSIAFLLLANIHPSVALAQSTVYKQTDEKPAALVRLPHGATTLGEVAAALSRQTGLKIHAAEYLTKRKMVLAMRPMPAAEALNLLADLNDWTWRETALGELRISRRAASVPTQVGNLPEALQAAIPKDFRAFLRLGETDLFNALASGRISTFPTPNRKPLTDPVSQAQKNINKASTEVTSDLVASLDFAVSPDTLKNCADLTEHQQDLLLKSLLFSRLINYQDSGRRLMSGDLTTFERFPEKIMLSLEGGLPHINAKVNIGDASFEMGFTAIEEEISLRNPHPKLVTPLVP